MGDSDLVSNSSLQEASVYLIGMAVNSFRLRLADRQFRVDYAVEVRQNIFESIFDFSQLIVVTGTIINKAVSNLHRFASRPQRHSLFRNASHSGKLPVVGKA